MIAIDLQPQYPSLKTAGENEYYIFSLFNMIRFEKLFNPNFLFIWAKSIIHVKYAYLILPLEI